MIVCVCVYGRVERCKRCLHIILDQDVHTVTLNLKSYFGYTSILQKGVIFYSALQKPLMLI
jgi:hypothetical protein